MQEFKTLLRQTSLILILFLIPNISLSKEFRGSFIAWGTNLDFVVHSELDPDEVDSIIYKAQKIPNSLELVLNSKNPNSELSRLNDLISNKKMELSKDLFFLIKEGVYYNEISDGYFDITVGSLNNHKSIYNELKNHLECIGVKNLVLDYELRTIIKKKKCTKIDLDGLAEGYVIRLMLKTFKESGIDDVLLNFGGNVSTLSNKSNWKVSIKNPDFNDEINSTVNLNNLSISTSSQYSKIIKIKSSSFSHILDPKQKVFKSKKNISISVISNDPIYSDVISTSLQAMPLEKALKFLKEAKDIKAIVLKKARNRETKTLFNNFQ